MYCSHARACQVCISSRLAAHCTLRCSLHPPLVPVGTTACGAKRTRTSWCRRPGTAASRCARYASLCSDMLLFVVPWCCVRGRQHQGVQLGLCCCRGLVLLSQGAAQPWLYPGVCVRRWQHQGVPAKLLLPCPDTISRAASEPGCCSAVAPCAVRRCLDAAASPAHCAWAHGCQLPFP